ncbi:hypothetical protein G6F68_013213 [Rhizopus microsporus]|nr:hypothetical protein G6F68_013213 [Rhizopus microsporus]
MAQRLLDALHGGRSADERHFVGFHCKCGFSQTPVLQDQTPLLGGMGDRGKQSVGRIGLGQEVVRAVAHALNGSGDIAMAGNENDGELRIDIAQAVEQLQAIDIGHANVRHDDPVEFPVQMR